MISTIAGIISVILFVGISIFQILLAAGLPLGRFAYGGKYEVLPNKLRIMSIVAVLIFTFASISVLVRVELIQTIPDSIVYDIAV